MGKLITREDEYSTKITKKDNLEFADLWNKTNVKIANAVQRATNASKHIAAKETAAAAKKHSKGSKS
jgi:hypothetical protein